MKSFTENFQYEKFFAGDRASRGGGSINGFWSRKPYDNPAEVNLNCVRDLEADGPVPKIVKGYAEREGLALEHVDLHKDEVNCKNDLISNFRL